MRAAALALALLLFSADGFAAKPKSSDDPECISGRQCLAKAQAAFAKRQWRRVEAMASLALDWAEPLDWRVTLSAFRLAAHANVFARAPLRALAWTEAGLNYRGPWFAESKLPPGAREDLGKLHLKLQRQVAATPRGDAFHGDFVQYAGRGVWNTLALEEVGPGRYRWQLDAYRVGRGLDPVLIRGPAQMSEGNEGIGTRTGDVVAIEYESAEYEAQHCHATIKPAIRGVNVVEGTRDCPMGNIGVNPWGPYRRVESRK